MKIHASGRKRGDENTVMITVRGTDWDIVNLIDQLGQGGGPAAVIAAELAATTGLVADRSDDPAQIARMLRHYADRLDSIPEQV